jgi:serine/threonine-protein kinase
MNKVLAKDPKWAQQNSDGRFYLAMLERDFNTAGSVAAEFPEKDAYEDGTGLGRAFYTAVVARLKGDTEKAKSALTNARLQQEQLVRGQPENGQVLCGLAMIDAELNRKEDALLEGKKAIDLMANPNHFFERAAVIEYFGIACARLGERDLALEQLSLAAKMPNGPTYGWLRLSPFWDPLRGDTRFEKIVESLKPRDVSK